MAEMIITVSPEGVLVVRSEGLTRAQWEEATAALRKESGTRFDPRVIDAFVRLGARTASRKDRAA